LAGVVEERIARRLLRLAFHEVALVDTVERRLDDARILPGLDLLLQPVAFGSAGNVDECWQPIEGGEDVVLDRAWPNHAGPTDHHWGTHASLPGGQFPALEGGGAAVREGDGLSAVVGSEDDDGVVRRSHVVKLLEHVRA